MQKLGINKRLREAILLPRFSDIRFTADMKFWVWNAIENGFEALESLQSEPATKRLSLPHTDAPTRIDGHTILYHATTRAKGLRLCNHESGKITLNAIRTATGDFAGQETMAYWTPQRELAVQYAQW